MHSSRVYEPIYTVKNMFNDFIILQDVFLTWKVYFLYILCGIWYYFQVTIITHLEPHYTISVRDFALNVRRHLVLTVGRRLDGGGFLLTKDVRGKKITGNSV